MLLSCQIVIRMQNVADLEYEVYNLSDIRLFRACLNNGISWY